MSIRGLQNYTEPLTLLGKITIKGNLNVKDLYVDGLINGSGVSTDILDTENTWTGTNDFQNVVTYTGTDVAVGNDLTTKKDVDDAVLAYDPLSTNNTWELSSTFSNAQPPLLPSTPITDNMLVGLSDFNNYITTAPTSLTTNPSNIFTGTNNFTNTFQVGSVQLEIPSQPNQLATKGYVDNEIEVAGKTLTYTITTPGTYNFSIIDRTKIGKIEYILFGGGRAGASGAMLSGSIGNALGSSGSLFLSVGIANDNTNYSNSGNYPFNVASNTFLNVSNVLIGGVVGGHILDGVNTPGSIYSFSGDDGSFAGVSGIGSNGRLGADNRLASNNLGLQTSAGGCILVAQYL